MADSVSGLAILGAVTGTLGLGLSVLNFFRDGSRVEVSLAWDFERFGPTAGLQPTGMVTVVNTGRRSTFVSHAHITSGGGLYILLGSLDGRTLTEGAEPYRLPVAQEKAAEELGAQWWRVRAGIEDVRGRRYFSPWPTKRPSFATASPPLLALPVARILNALRRFRP
jgi:hypothetical protein